MSVLKHLRSSTADKRPAASGLSDGQLAINTASGSPGLYFKDSNGTIAKVGPAHVGSSAPNAVPAGSAGNSVGELWVDTSLTTIGLKYYSGSDFVNLTPSGTTTVVGLVELATPAETQAGSDGVRAVTPSGLQSKISDSISTTSSTTIASSTAVKTAYDLANAALPKAGGTVTGELLIGNTGSLVFEGSTDNTLETTLAVTDPTADRTITLPDVSGTVITTGDTGTVTSTMILNGTILDADINASAAIAGSKISPNFGSQNITTSGTSTAASFIPTSSGIPATGIYLPAANTLGIATNSTGRLFINSTGNIGLGQSSPTTTVDVNGAYSQNIVAVAALDIDCSAGNYFTKTINGNSTFTVSNVPASRAYGFTLELTHTSGTITWFSGVEWPGGVIPSPTAGKTHLFMFLTDDGGTRWRASSLLNYTN